MANKSYDLSINNIYGRSSGSLNASFAVAKQVDRIAWIAGSVIVVRDSQGSVVHDRYLQLPVLGATQSNESSRTPSRTSSPALERHVKEDHDPGFNTKGRGNTIVSIAISPDGRWLACGEQGHRPRLCVFDLSFTERYSANPSYTLSDAHTYGIKTLVFSPNSASLVSIGYVHDGGIHVWEISEHSGIRQLASNRVTAKLKAAIWLGDQELATIGQRHIRVWSLQHDKSAKSREHLAIGTTDRPVVLEGRNVILGQHVMATFISACAFGFNHFLVATIDAIYLVNFREQLGLKEILQVDFQISYIGICSDFLLIGSSNGLLRRYQFSESTILTSKIHLTALMLVEENKFNSGIKDHFQLESPKTIVTLADGSVCNISSEQSTLPTVSSLCCWEQGRETLVGGGDGVVRKLDSHGHVCQEINFDHVLGRSVTTIKPINQHLLMGTSDGDIILCSSEPGFCTFTVRAHEKEVFIIECSSDTKMILSCSTDRSIQLFDYDSDMAHLTLRQTFTEHSASISEAIFVQASHLISCSADRTVIIRTRVVDCTDDEAVFLPVKVVDLRAAALSMVLLSENKILVAALNKTLLMIDIESGSIETATKTEDTYEHLALSPDRRLCCGVTSHERALYLISPESGFPLSLKRTAHVKSITSVHFSERSPDLIYTTSSDGLLVAWTFVAAQASVTTPVKRIFPRSQGKPYHKFPANLRRNTISSPRNNPSSPRTPLSPSKLSGHNSLPSRSNSSHDSPESQADKSETISAICRDTIAKLHHLEACSDALQDRDRLALQKACEWLLQPGSIT